MIYTEVGASSVNDDGSRDRWRFLEYESWQMVLRWKEPLHPRLKALKDKMPRGFKSLRVEIQIGTVVTQAWGEVQHNILYKPSNDFITTPSMKRIIDGTNGLAITTEIMLKDLKHNIEKSDARSESIQLTAVRKQCGVSGVVQVCLLESIESARARTLEIFFDHSSSTDPVVLRERVFVL